jgi:hypothetical protein
LNNSISLWLKNQKAQRKEKTNETKDLINELEMQKPLKWDQKIESSQLQMVLDGNQVRFQIDEKDNPFLITRPCHNQIVERFEIPMRNYSKMENEAPELLMENVNTWLKKNSKEVFIRGLGNSVKAFLSDRYRVIDHLDVLYCSMNELQAYETEVEDCYLSETEMNVKVKSNQLKDFVRHRDDLIVGGLLLINSETGHRALRVEPRMFREKSLELERIGGRLITLSREDFKNWDE